MRRPATGGRAVQSLVAASVFGAAAALAWQSIASKPLRRVDVATAIGSLNLELATTPDQRTAGLSHRDTMSTDALLLLWPEAARHPIWMKDMRFALDLAWLDAEGRVVAVVENAAPCAADPCPLFEPPGSAVSIAVLELPAGDAKKRGIAVGSQLPIPNAEGK